MRGVNTAAQTARIFRAEIRKKNGNETPLTSLSKSSTSFILVTSAVQRGKMLADTNKTPRCHNSQTRQF